MVRGGTPVAYAEASTGQVSLYSSWADDDFAVTDSESCRTSVVERWSWFEEKRHVGCRTLEKTCG